MTKYGKLDKKDALMAFLIIIAVKYIN